MNGRRFFRCCVLIAALLPLLLPELGWAASTVTCHCFRDREFSPNNPAAYDPYLLATVQNRLLAYTFRLPRKEVVREKMAGTAGDDLWVTHWLARAAGLPVTDVQSLFARQPVPSWRATVTELAVPPEALGRPFMEALPGDDRADLAWAVVAQVFEQALGVPAAAFTTQRTQVTLQEAILATLLHVMSGDRISDPLQNARKRGNWSQVVVVEAGTSVEAIDAFLAQKLPPVNK